MTTKGQFAAKGACHGVFGLFSMGLPTLLPLLRRTTISGFCNPIGRIDAPSGTVFVGIFVQAAEAVADFRTALRVTGGLFIPPASDANMLPSKPEQTHGTVNTVD